MDTLIDRSNVPDNIPDEDVPIYRAAEDFYTSHMFQDIHEGVPEDTRKFGDYFLSNVVGVLDSNVEFSALPLESKQLFYIVLHAAWIWGWKAAQGIDDKHIITKGKTDD